RLASSGGARCAGQQADRAAPDGNSDPAVPQPGQAGRDARPLPASRTQAFRRLRARRRDCLPRPWLTLRCGWTRRRGGWGRRDATGRRAGATGRGARGARLELPGGGAAAFPAPARPARRSDARSFPLGLGIQPDA
ncbi:hypothetical protein QU38_00820, partial [Staphylococcus aureus]